MVKKTDTKHHTKKAKKIGTAPDQVHPRQVLLYAIIILLGAVLVVSILSRGTFFLSDVNLFTKSDVPLENVVLVTVNGEPIMQSELDMHWDALSVYAKMQMTRTQLLESLVFQKLLMQEANKQEVAMSDADVDAFIEEQLLVSGMSYADLEANLEAQGTTLDDLKVILKEDLTLRAFTLQFEELNPVSEEELEAIYVEFKDELYQEELVTVQHILIEINEEFTDEFAQLEVEDILSQLDEEDNANFCELVELHSMDLGSVGNCGEYTFGRGQMFPEFEEMSFNLEVGERGVAKTDAGYHIIVKIDEHEAKQLTLDDRLLTYDNKPLLREVLAENVVQEKLMNYAQSLYDEATIVFSDVELSDEPEFPFELIAEGDNFSEEDFEIVSIEQVSNESQNE